MPSVDEAQSLVLRAARRRGDLVARACAAHDRARDPQRRGAADTMHSVLDTAIGPARQVVLLLSLLTALALTLGVVGYTTL